MPPQETIWRAEPHTIAKIQILSSYLKAYFPILGRKRNNQPLLYIDGFAGPGEYTNFASGSPVVALEAAQNALTALTSDRKASVIHCAFVEENADRYINLTERLETLARSEKVIVHTYNTKFVQGLEQIKRDIPTPLHLATSIICLY